MALQDLQHPYICGYKEFFVTWDKQVNSNLGFSYEAIKFHINF